MSNLNTIPDITTGLTLFGRELLSITKKSLILSNLIPRTLADRVEGGVATFPDIALTAGASTRNAGDAATATAMTSSTRSLAVKHFYQGARIEDFDAFITNINNTMFRMAQMIGYNLAEKFDSYVCGLWNEWPYEKGPLDGSAAFNSTDLLNPLVDSLKILKDNKIPPGPLYGVLSTKESAAFRKLIQLQKVNEAGTSSLLRTGALGSIMGFDLYESQNIPDATMTQADVSWTATGVQPVGTTSLVTGAQGTGTVPAGMTFSIAGDPNRYVVTADATISGNAATLLIYPALKVATGGGDVITAISHSAASSMNLVFHPEAFRTVVGVGAPKNAGLNSVVVRDPDSSLAMRVTYESIALGAAGVAFTESVTADFFGGAKTVRPEWVVKITGD